MEFIISERGEENCYEITSDKNCLKGFSDSGDLSVFAIGFETLNLGRKLYGKSKSESVKIQSENAKYLLKVYKIIKKAVSVSKRRGNQSVKILIPNLSQKANNNDIMLRGLLETDFNAPLFGKMKYAYEWACDFLDAENSLNKMCDFHDNHCTKHRDKNIDKTTGCCPGFCKIREVGKPCKHKNLSCKIFMCDYLIYEKGFYFTPNTLAILKKHMTPLERMVCFGSLCRTEKKSLNFLWLMRGLSVLYILVFLWVICMIIFKII